MLKTDLAVKQSRGAYASVGNAGSNFADGSYLWVAEPLILPEQILFKKPFPTSWHAFSVKLWGFNLLDPEFYI